MSTLLNIELHTNDGAPNLKLVDVISALDTLGLSITGAWIHDSDTEPTAVVLLQNDGISEAQARILARVLHRGCVAVYNPSTGEGALYGPAAAKWDEFNPACFIMPDGAPLKNEPHADLNSSVPQAMKIGAARYFE